MSDEADRSRELQDLHDKGEQDQRTNNYDPPGGGPLWQAFDHFTSTTQQEKERQEEVDAYDKGWENAPKQR